MTPFLNESLLPNGVVGVILGDNSPVEVVNGKQGYTAELVRGTTTAVGASDVRSGAVRFTETGILRMYNATGGVPAGSVIVDGFAITTDGQLCYTTASPSNAAQIGGISVNSSGAVHVADLSPAAWYRAGVGQTDAGSGACSAWADQSGNGRNLLQGTGANRPTIQSDGSLLFDGSNDFMQLAFSLTQPCSIYIVMSQITWTINEYVFDGATGNVALVQDDLGVSPDLEIFAGTRLRPLSGPALGTRSVVTSIFNGANSLLQLNSGTALTGNAGANNPGGITLGSALNGISFHSNIRVWELIVRSGADGADNRAKIYGYLRRKYSI